MLPKKWSNPHERQNSRLPSCLVNGPQLRPSRSLNIESEMPKISLREPIEIILNGISLDRILILHSEWLRTSYKKGAPAVLSNVDLKRADLRGIIIKGAHLYRADLKAANLNNADFTAANLEKADLSRSKIGRAHV